METLRNAGGEIVDPARDQPGLVIRGLIGATAAGTAVVALALWGVRTLLAQAPASEQAVVNGPAFFVLIGGTLGGVAVAVAVTWWILAPLTASWRRGAFSMISGFGTVIGALAAAPVHQALGRQGLLLMASVAGGLAAIILASLRRSR